ESLALYFVAILWLPFESWNAQLNIEAMERGTTGAREAAVLLLEPDRFPKADPNEAVRVSSVDEMFARMRARPLAPLPSDDPKYDDAFPEHPLSQVRSRLSEILPTIRFHVEKKALAPFRKRPWWKVW